MDRSIIKEANKSINIGNSIGGITIDSDMYIVVADISFHAFLWENTYFPITEIIHPDYINDFNEMISEVTDENAQEMFLLIKGNDEIYIPAFVTAKKSSYKQHGNLSYDLEFSNVIMASRSIKKYDFLIRKLSEIVTLCGYVLFEYDVNTANFKIYYELKGNRNIIYDGVFSEFKENIISQNLIEPESIGDFNEFCNDVQRCRGTFSYDMKCSFLPGVSSKELITIKGSTVNDNLNAILVVGIISTENNSDHEGNFFTDKANLDPLTSILNKRAITEYATRLVNNAKGRYVAITIMDVDYFKNINDTYGHMIGDEILMIIANVLREATAGKGVPGRFGGDEFFIVFNNIESENELRLVVREIRFKIELLCREKVSGLSVTCTLGIAQCPMDAQDYDKLFRTADKALYIGKLKGRNRFIIYKRSLHGDVDEAAETGGLNIKLAKTPQFKRKSVNIALKYLSGRDNASMKELLYSIIDNFDIDDIRIYMGEEPKMKYCHLENESYCDEGIESFYELDNRGYYDEEDNLLIMDNYIIFKYKEKEFFDYLSRNQILSSLTYIIKKDGVKLGFINYVVKSGLRKWSEWDINMILIISRILDEALTT